MNILDKLDASSITQREIWVCIEIYGLMRKMDKSVREPLKWQIMLSGPNFFIRNSPPPPLLGFLTMRKPVSYFIISLCFLNFFFFLKHSQIVSFIFLSFVFFFLLFVLKGRQKIYY